MPQATETATEPPTLAALLERSYLSLRYLSQERTLHAADLGPIVEDLDQARGLAPVRPLVTPPAATLPIAPATAPEPPPVITRIVLAAPSGHFYERAMYPDEVRPTTNPLAALNWPDLPTALAAVAAKNYRLAHAWSGSPAFVFQRITILVAPLAPGETDAALQQLAGEQAVAG